MVALLAPAAASCSGAVSSDDLRSAESVVNGLTVGGDPGRAPVVRMRTPLEIDETSTVVTVSGPGAPIQVDQLFVIELTLYDARRFTWAARSLAGLVFLGFAAYLVDELLSPSGPNAGPGARSAHSLTEALLGLVFIGLPCLWFSLWGRRGPHWMRRVVVPFIRPIVVLRGIELPEERWTELAHRARATLVAATKKGGHGVLTVGILLWIVVVAGAHTWLTRAVPALSNPAILHFCTAESQNFRFNPTYTLCAGVFSAPLPSLITR